MNRRACLLATTLLITACTTQERAVVPAAPRAEEGAAAASPVPSRAVVAALPPSGDARASAAAPAAPGLAIALPDDAIYVCVVQRPDRREQTVIEFTPKVLELCRRHPEMGPCQYERNQCRTAGGRVYAKGGEEITLAHEAEYDRKVMRVRFRAN